MKIHKLYVKQIQPMERAEINGKETLKLIEVVLEEDFFFVFCYLFKYPNTGRIMVRISKNMINYMRSYEISKDYLLDLTYFLLLQETKTA